MLLVYEYVGINLMHLDIFNIIIISWITGAIS
jgi:hypothetical protein